MAGHPYHEPVLLHEAVEYLVTDPGGVYLDGTVGGGGHAEGICRQLTGNGRLICCDADRVAIRYAEERLREYRERISFVESNFADVEEKLLPAGRVPVNGVLLDLGVSSYQLDEPSRGFTFRTSAPLDMRFGRGPVRADEIVNGYSMDELARVIRTYGEEHAARRIAARIVARRPVRTTVELADAAGSAVGPRHRTKTLARVFQAIRIEVNGELENLSRGLSSAVRMLRAGGRLVVISYHSLEDRIVKEFFRGESAPWIRSAQPLVPDTPAVPSLRVLTRRPVTPGEEEKTENPRARSAKMRVAERTGAEQ